MYHGKICTVHCTIKTVYMQWRPLTILELYFGAPSQPFRRRPPAFNHIPDPYILFTKASNSSKTERLPCDFESQNRQLLITTQNKCVIQWLCTAKRSLKKMGFCQRTSNQIFAKKIGKIPNFAYHFALFHSFHSSPKIGQ